MTESIPGPGQISLHPISAAIDQVAVSVRELHGADSERQAEMLNWLGELKRQVVDRCEGEDNDLSFFMQIAPPHDIAPEPPKP